MILLTWPQHHCVTWSKVAVKSLVEDGVLLSDEEDDEEDEEEVEWVLAAESVENVRLEAKVDAGVELDGDASIQVGLRRPDDRLSDGS